MKNKRKILSNQCMWRFQNDSKQLISRNNLIRLYNYFFEVYYYQRFIITWNITYENKMITFLKLNEFDQFYKNKLVAYLVPETFQH